MGIAISYGFGRSARTPQIHTYYDPGGAYVGPAYAYAADYHVHGQRGWRGGHGRAGCALIAVTVIVLALIIIFAIWLIAAHESTISSKPKTKQCVECLYDEPHCYGPPCYCRYRCNKYEYIR